jgi:hypothetical protein
MEMLAGSGFEKLKALQNRGNLLAETGAHENFGMSRNQAAEPCVPAPSPAVAMVQSA